MQNLLSRFLALLAGVVIGVGVVIGALTLLQDDGVASTKRPTTGSQNEEPLPQGDTAPNTGLSGLGSSISVPSNIDDLVFPKHAFDRTAAIVSWVAALSDDQILNWLEQTTEPSSLASAEHRNELQSTLLQKLTITAPDQALNFARSRDEFERIAMTSTVFLAWASFDLDGAITRAKSMDPQETTRFLPAILQAGNDLSLERQREIAKELGNESYAFSNYFRNLSKGTVGNPKETWYEIVNLANRESVQNTTGSALSSVAVKWIEKQGMEVLDEIVSSIAHDSEYSSVISHIFSALSTDQPEEIFDYIVNNLGDRANDIIQGSSVVFNWARKDPKAVLAKAETLPPSGLRQRLVWNAVWHWAENNPREVLDELELVPQEHREDARRNAIRAYASTSPSKAAKYILQIPEYDSRLALANTLVREWSYKDADAAKEWVLNLPDSDPMRTALIPPLASALVTTDPRAAFQLALEQPIEENNSGSFSSTGYESSILSMIAYQDVDLAIELLPQVRESGRNYAYSTIGDALVRNGEVQQALNLASQLPSKEQTQYFHSVSSMWALQDPQSLLKAFDDFPTAEIKSSVALRMSMFNTSTNAYTAKEIERLEEHMNKEDRDKYEKFQGIDFGNPSPEDQKFLQELYSL